jgi:hypothetical protein
MYTTISSRAALDSDVKFCCLLSSWDMSVSDFHGEDTGLECHDG